MDNFIVAKSKNTLGVELNSDSGILELKGSSFPENANEFFEPIISWINKYMMEVTGKITLNFKFDYLNSSSIKYVSDIVEKLDFYAKSGGEVVINWYYEENDEDIMEMGEDLKVDVSLNFNIIMN